MTSKEYTTTAYQRRLSKDLYDRLKGQIKKSMSLEIPKHEPDESDVDALWAMFYSLINEPAALYEVATRGKRWERNVFLAFRKKFKLYPEYEYCYTVFIDNASLKLRMP